MATAAELAGASSAEVAAARTALSAHVSSLYPQLAVGAGPMSDLVLGPAADALAAVDRRAKEAVASLNPEAALASGVYDEAVLNAALAGRGVARYPATSASGSAAFVFSSNAGRTVTSGYRLRAVDGTRYRVSSMVQFLPTTGSPVGVTQVVLVADSSGRFVGTAPVVAESVGLAGNRPAGASLVPDSPMNSLAAVYLATSASGGSNKESDAELLARLPAASAPRTVASFEGAQNVVQSAAWFSDVAVVGYGHEGMRRGRSVLTGQTPGRMDVRVRTNSAPERLRLPVVATYKGPSNGYGVWQFTVHVDEAPGWFAVERVVLPGDALTAGGYLPSQVSPGYDVSSAATPVDVRAASDAYFSRYATVTVQFVDARAPGTDLVPDVSTAKYDAVLRVIPGIVDAQDACDDCDARAAGGDCLVRSASPVMVSVTVEGFAPASAGLTPGALAAAVARAINASRIAQNLYGSAVGAAALALLPTGVSLQLSKWSGKVYRCDGSTATVVGVTGLAVGTDWDYGLGEDAVAFYADAESVNATVTTI